MATKLSPLYKTFVTSGANFVTSEALVDNQDVCSFFFELAGRKPVLLTQKNGKQKIRLRLGNVPH